MEDKKPDKESIYKSVFGDLNGCYHTPELKQLVNLCMDEVVNARDEKIKQLEAEKAQLEKEKEELREAIAEIFNTIDRHDRSISSVNYSSSKMLEIVKTMIQTVLTRSSVEPNNETNEKE